MYGLGFEICLFVGMLFGVSGPNIRLHVCGGGGGSEGGACMYVGAVGGPEGGTRMYVDGGSVFRTKYVCG